MSDPLVVRAVLLAVLGLAVLAIEAAAGRRLRPELRSAAWWSVLIVAIVPAASIAPPGLGSLITAPLPADDLVRPWLVPWAAGALGVVAVTAFRHVRARRSVAAAAPAPRRVTALAADVARSLGLQRAVPVRVVGEGGAAAVVGVVRPVVLLSADVIARGAERELRCLLAHELAHVARRDPWQDLASRAIAALWWWHPAVRIACRRLAGLRELGADAAALRVDAVTAPDYRRALLGAARGWIVPGASAFVTSGSLLLARLRALEARSAPPGRARRLRAGVAAVLLVGAALPPAARAPAPALTDLPGCLQLRFAVLGALAAEE